MGSVASPFISDDAIVGLAQPLTEALNRLASGLWGACNLIEELGRREEFYVNRAGSSSTARAVALRGRLSTTPISPINCPAVLGLAEDFLFAKSGRLDCQETDENALSLWNRPRCHFGLFVSDWHELWPPGASRGA
jgi:hypothetical protein